MARTVREFVGVKITSTDLIRLKFAEAMERKGRSEIVRTALRQYLAGRGVSETLSPEIPQTVVAADAA